MIDIIFDTSTVKQNIANPFDKNVIVIILLIIALLVLLLQRIRSEVMVHT